MARRKFRMLKKVIRFSDDLPFRFRLDAGVAVVKALLYSQLDLFRG